MKKTILTAALGVIMGITAISCYADSKPLGTTILEGGKKDTYNYIYLSPLGSSFNYDIHCTIHNEADASAAIKLKQRFNDFGKVTLNGEQINKNSENETVQMKLKVGDSELIIENVNDRSGVIRSDRFEFTRATTDSHAALAITCSAEPPHNPLPPAPPAIN